MLEQFPPQIVEPPARRAALIRLDDILHIESANRNPLVQKFYRTRMERAVGQIGSVRIPNGAQIWKLYNHGFFVRTPTVAIAFDIVPGISSIPGFAVDFSRLRDVLCAVAAAGGRHHRSDGIPRR